MLKFMFCGESVVQQKCRAAKVFSAKVHSAKVLAAKVFAAKVPVTELFSVRWGGSVTPPLPPVYDVYQIVTKFTQ